MEKSNDPPRLNVCYRRPRKRHSNNQRNELPPPHLITLARAVMLLLRQPDWLTAYPVLGRCQTKALQVKLSLFKVAPMRGTRHYDIRQRSEPRNCFSRLIKTPHMSAAGCEKAVARRPI